MRGWWELGRVVPPDVEFEREGIADLETHGGGVGVDGVGSCGGNDGVVGGGGGGEVEEEVHVTTSRHDVRNSSQATWPSLVSIFPN